VQAVVLTEAVGAVAGGHEEGRMPRVEAGFKDLFKHIPGGEHRRVTLLAGGKFSAEAQGLFVGLREHLGPDPAGPKGRGYGVSKV